MTEPAPSPTRKAMRHAGYKAHKVWTQDDNGGMAMVERWHILKQDTPPQPGAMTGGFLTRREAWSVAEDEYERRMAWVRR